MWWAMKLARGEKTVRSMPRSSISRSWLASMLARISSSVICSAAGSGALSGSPIAATCAVRHASSGAGAVV